MAKFPIDRFPPGFFDVTQDLVRSLPFDVIDRWTRSDHSLDAALKLLAPAAVSGAVVSTDSAGLTRLTQSLGVLEILSLINAPKELVHAYGAAVGGESIGIWAADNTEMFYPEGVNPEEMASMLLTAMDSIRKDCQVQIGAGVHRGRFFKLGGGLYGTEADRVEELAENYTEGGEIVLTDDFCKLLGGQFVLEPRSGLPEGIGPGFRLLDGPRLKGVEPTDFRYPLPYTQDFYEFLREHAHKQDALPERYRTQRAVVLVEREREEPDVPEIAVLNDLALSAAMGRIGAQLRRDFGGDEIKTAGSISIHTFPDCQTAFAFACAFRNEFLEHQVATRIGIDHGEVLVFQLPTGGVDTAGMPVNLASKMAQDYGEFGRIYLTANAADQCGVLDLETVKMVMHGIEVEARVA